MIYVDGRLDISDTVAQEQSVGAVFLDHWILGDSDQFIYNYDSLSYPIKEVIGLCPKIM